MTAKKPSQKELLSRLNTFRPSDRSELTKAFNSPNGRDDAFSAVQNFVMRWETADWLEAYSIERIGKWIAKYQPENVVRHLKTWAEEQETEPRKALLRGIRLGNDERNFHPV